MPNFGPTALQKFVLQISLHIIFIIPFYSLVRGRGRSGRTTTFDISSDEDVVLSERFITRLLYLLQ